MVRNKNEDGNKILSPSSFFMTIVSGSLAGSHADGVADDAAHRAPFGENRPRAERPVAENDGRKRNQGKY